MTKNLYVSAWLLLAAVVLVSAFGGALTPAVLFVFSLAALSLVYGLALWSVIANTRAKESE